MSDPPASSSDTPASSDEHRRRKEPRQVRLPGFLADEPIGLGDLVKRATSSVGIQPCGGCARRAARLNSWLAFGGRGSKQR